MIHHAPDRVTFSYRANVTSWPVYISLLSAWPKKYANHIRPHFVFCKDQKLQVRCRQACKQTNLQQHVPVHQILGHKNLWYNLHEAGEDMFILRSTAFCISLIFSASSSISFTRALIASNSCNRKFGLPLDFDATCQNVKILLFTLWSLNSSFKIQDAKLEVHFFLNFTLTEYKLKQSALFAATDSGISAVCLWGELEFHENYHQSNPMITNHPLYTSRQFKLTQPA